MGFRSVRIYRFRNLEDTEIEFTDKDIFLVGENGQGKTNFLESIYLLCVGSSFRTRNESLLVKYGSSEMSLIGEYADEDESKTIKLKIEKGQKSIRIDDARIRDRKELIYSFPCIAFTHDDINFVNGPPALRRLFINQTISLYDGAYLDSLRAYNRIIRLRNSVLKQKRSDLLSVYDVQISEAGIQLQQKRAGLVDEFNKTFSSLYRNITGSDTDLRIRYSPSWKEELTVERMVRFLSETRERDFFYGTTTSGPHRDRMGFYNGGKNYAATASTGQIRLISLVLRASQASFCTLKSGRLPVLLLDDVLLEMDLQKRRRFLDALPDYSQAFYTFLPDEGLVGYRENGPVYNVAGGRITSGGAI